MCSFRGICRTTLRLCFIQIRAAFRRYAQAYALFCFPHVTPIGEEMHGKGSASRCTHRIEKNIGIIQSNQFIQVRTHLWSAYTYMARFPLSVSPQTIACTHCTVAHTPCTRWALHTAHRCFLIVGINDRNTFNTTKKGELPRETSVRGHRIESCADEHTKN